MRGHLRRNIEALLVQVRVRGRVQVAPGVEQRSEYVRRIVCFLLYIFIIL